MINFLLGFWLADLLFSLILFYKKEILLSFNRDSILFSIIVDIVILVMLLVLNYVRNKNNQS
jgi:hypothetical protein